MKTPPFTVCIPAAGSGRRMNLDVPKQYFEIAGKPVLIHTITVFDAIRECRRVIVATDDRSRLENVLARFPMCKPVSIVPGGASRQESVANMLAECADEDEIVLIHDAVRPCIEAAQVMEVVRKVSEHGTAILAIPAGDTIKQVAGAKVTATLDRSAVWLAQTPQGARCGLFRRAFLRAAADGITQTDDASLLERIGIEVCVVPGSSTNLKITTGQDLLVAETILLRHMKSP